MALAGKVIVSVYYWTDLYLAQDVADDQLADAIADAFQVSRDRVAIADASVPRGRILNNPQLFAVIERSERQAEPGDRFPVGFSIGLVDSAQPFDELAVLRAVAPKLALPYVSDVPGDDEDTWRLILPNGETRPVTVDEESHFTLNAADRAVVDQLLGAPTRLVG